MQNVAHPPSIETDEMTERPLVIAIDGPSGSGKSSTARGVASKLGLSYLDTGSMYRAIAVAYLQRELTPEQTDAIEALVDESELTILDDPQAPGILLDGQDITQTIREPRVSQHVSIVATNPHVREVLTDQMRALIDAAAVSYTHLTLPTTPYV